MIRKYRDKKTGKIYEEIPFDPTRDNDLFQKGFLPVDNCGWLHYVKKEDVEEIHNEEA